MAKKIICDRCRAAEDLDAARLVKSYTVAIEPVEKRIYDLCPDCCSALREAIAKTLLPPAG